MIKLFRSWNNKIYFIIFCILSIHTTLLYTSPLHDAIENDDIQEVQRLLSPNNINELDTLYGSTPLMIAAVNDFYQITKLLLTIKNIDINAQNFSGFTVLHYTDSPEIAKLLIDAGADVNLQDNYGDTPLHHHLIYESFDDEDEDFMEEVTRYNNLITLFIESGADLNKRNNHLETPLLTALTYESYIAAKLLLAHSSMFDINAQEDYGLTALHIAAIDDSLEIAQLLINAGANIDQCDNEDHCTPLHLAVHENSLNVAKQLIKSGADTNIQDKLGFTARTYCTTPEMRKILKR